MREGDSFQLFGFPANESAFLTGALRRLGLLPTAGAADLLLVNGVECSRHLGLSDTQIRAAGVVCVVTTLMVSGAWRRQMKNQFPHVREYGLLPQGNPRVVVPLSSYDQIRTALGLHRPGRWIGRFGLALAAMLARFGNHTLLQARGLLIGSRTPHALPYGAVRAGLSVQEGLTDFALYLGTPDHNRKTVVLPLGQHVPTTILKVAHTPSACQSLRNEVVALTALECSQLRKLVPRLERVCVGSDYLSMHQEFRLRVDVSQERLKGAVVDFLGSLSHISVSSGALSDVLNELPLDSVGQFSEEPCTRKLRVRLEAYADTGAAVLFHRNHGDFAPWNCQWSSQGLYVFDWEESSERALALGDAFYYASAPALHVQRRPKATRVVADAIELGEAVAAAAGHSKLDVQLYLALWLLERVRGGPLYGEMLLALERDWRQ